MCYLPLLSLLGRPSLNPNPKIPKCFHGFHTNGVKDSYYNKLKED